MTTFLVRFLSVALLATATCSAALADSLTDGLVADLRGQGYARVTLTRTWLGRILIIGFAEDGQREIVVNPNTGEILRDYFRARIAAPDADNDPSSGTTVLPSPSGAADKPRPDPRPDRPDRTPPKDDDPGSDDGTGLGISDSGGGGEEIGDLSDPKDDPKNDPEKPVTPPDENGG